MIASFHATDTQSAVAAEIQNLLPKLGSGVVDGTAYDTAWAARLAPHYPSHGFDQALEWLREHQHDDGTWGADVDHYHDRYVSTLVAIIALREAGRDGRDPRRIQHGEDALWRIVGKLRTDDSDSIGFPLLSISLPQEAAALGLDVPQPPVRFATGYQKKVKAILSQPMRQWRTSPITFSWEGLRAELTDGDELLAPNYSVGGSPSATAAYLLARPDEGALRHLQDEMRNNPNGGLGAASPIDLFEVVWSLNHLRMANAVDRDDLEVRRALNFLWEVWSSWGGTGYCSQFPVVDLDDTAACFMVLRWGGYEVSTDAFLPFERADHFCCYPEETNPSVSAHVRFLAALRTIEDEIDVQPWIKKVVGALHRFDENGAFWWDKWHVSPYYVNSLAIHTLYGIDDDLARRRFRWIIRTQNGDGGWGYFGDSTPEETAYVLEALLIWDRHVERLEPTILDRAAKYLQQRLHTPFYTPLWIGKSLYSPRHLIKAAVLSALHSHFNRD